MTRIMVIVGYPQDPFERAGRTVARHLSRGDEAMFVSLTTGVVTHAFDTFPAAGEDKLSKIMERVDGGVGYLHHVGYAEQISRLNPALVQYLPAG